MFLTLQTIRAQLTLPNHVLLTDTLLSHKHTVHHLSLPQRWGQSKLMAHKKIAFSPSKEEKMSVMDFMTRTLAGGALLSPLLAAALDYLWLEESCLLSCCKKKDSMYLSCTTHFIMSCN